MVHFNPAPAFLPDLDVAEARIVNQLEALAAARMNALFHFHTQFTGATAKAWLIKHGATDKQADEEFLAVLNARRAANGTPPVGTCTKPRGHRD